MFIKIDNKTKEEEIISSEEMAEVLEADFKPDDIDEVLTEIVTGIYKHRTRSATYTYKV